MPHAHKFCHVRVWQTMGNNQDGSCVCVTWMNMDAECCSVHACITLRRFCTAHDTRTRHHAVVNPHPCTRILACCSARMYSTYAHIHTHARHMTTGAYDTNLLFGKPGRGKTTYGPVRTRNRLSSPVYALMIRAVSSLTVGSRQLSYTLSYAPAHAQQPYTCCIHMCIHTRTVYTLYTL